MMNDTPMQSFMNQLVISSNVPVDIVCDNCISHDLVPPSAIRSRSSSSSSLSSTGDASNEQQGSRQPLSCKKQILPHKDSRWDPTPSHKIKAVDMLIPVKRNWFPAAIAATARTDSSCNDVAASLSSSSSSSSRQELCEAYIQEALDILDMKR